MATSTPPIRIGIYGPEEAPSRESRGCALWATGYAAALTMAGATPVRVEERTLHRSWKELLGELDGIVFTGGNRITAHTMANEAQLCEWCRKHRLPLLGVDQGLHALNATFGGTLYVDVGSELPEALQHRHPPEKGLRHAISVELGTRLADLYGEGELVVNSEHRRAVCKVARGFRVSARALDGVIEAIESDLEDWFGVGVQWRPASASASGLDIQLFRGLVDAARQRQSVQEYVPSTFAA
jgi:putative glutamine amidotransferase